MSDNRSLATVEEAAMVTMSERSIDNIVYNATMAERMVTTLLEREIDYGRTPGTSSDGLWDAGAAKIINSFNCYVDHQVLFQKDEDNLISWCIQANVISRTSQTIVGTGVGAASTKEKKYKYRWVRNPKDYGYSQEEIKKMQFKDGQYRIINPEYGELVNTIFLMAAKRAEVDAARAMPGVGGALKKLFDHKIAPSEDNPWKPFYTMASRMGLTDAQAKEKLGVKSMKDWKGTVEDAILKLATTVSREVVTQEATGAVQEIDAEPFPEDDVPPGEIFAPGGGEPRTLPERTAGEFEHTTDLLRICYQDFGITKVNTVFKELGFKNQSDYEASKPNHYNSYLEIKALHAGEQGKDD